MSGDQRPADRTGDRASARDTRTRIRDARAGEREVVRALTLRAYAEYATIMTPTAWRRLEGAVRGALDDARSAAEWIVAESLDDGVLLGSVMLYPAETAAYGDLTASATAPELRLLCVTPEARGLGVGQALVEECIRRARLAGARELGLHTSVSMQAAIRMYRRLGFIRTPERDFRPPGAELVEGYSLPLSGRA